MNKIITLLTAACLAAVAAASGPRTVNDGVYTEAQAESGEALYEQHCKACHDDRYFRPVLRRWEGQSLGIFYTVMITSMPESNPGALALDEYADILAYILSLSRYPEGDDALDPSPEAMQQITIAGRN